MSDPVVRRSHEMIRQGSKSFAAAARLFDPQTRARAYMLYAWCRHCDDQIDGQELGFGCGELPAAERLRRLQQLRDSTRAAFGDAPIAEPVFAALQRVAREADLAERHAMELLAGFEMDVTGVAYELFEDTLLYCYRVAGVVGVMMANVMGVREPAVLARAADLGIAFQLTNISRDVIADAAIGRCYLPATWLRAAGVGPGEVADPRHLAAVHAVVARLLAEADRYYVSALEGLTHLPLRSAWAISTALGVYRDIGRIVLARGDRAWAERAVVSRPRKAWLGVMGLARAVHAVTIGRMNSGTPREATLWMVADLAEDQRG
jgi:phytoene synthase